MSMHEGLPVEGYRPQSSESVDLVNANKALEEQCLRSLDALVGKADMRWLRISREYLELAFMAANRAVFQPGRAKLPGDAP